MMSVCAKLAVLAGISLASAEAGAVSCHSDFSGGAIRIVCSEPGFGKSQCDWSAEVTAEGGTRGLFTGTFVIAKSTKTQLVVNESRFNGKKLSAARIRVGACAIGVR